MVEAAATTAPAARVRSHRRRMRVRNAHGRERGREPTLSASENLEHRPRAGRKRAREHHPDFLPARGPGFFKIFQGGSPRFESLAHRRSPHPGARRRPSLYGHLFHQRRCRRRSVRLRLSRQSGPVSNIRFRTGSIYRAGFRIGGRRRLQSCGDQVEMGRHVQRPLRRGARPPVRPVKRRLLTLSEWSELVASLRQERIPIGSNRDALLIPWLCACPYRKTGSHFSGTCAREGDMMLNGIVVLVLAIAVLAAVWALILYGSTYFGPR